MRLNGENFEILCLLQLKMFPCEKESTLVILFQVFLISVMNPTLLCVWTAGTGHHFSSGTPFTRVTMAYIT